MRDDPRFGHRSGLEVAVIGMAGRFPGAAGVDALWANLRAGVDSIKFFSRDELIAAGVEPALCDDPRYVPAKGYVEGAELFDADFFAIGAREAEVLDPQHRLFLECAWEALERAAYDPDRYPGWIGVYAGSAMSSYYLKNLRSRGDLVEAVGHLQASLGNDKDYLATRTSYKLNLEGPSLNVQTACSTSLVAVHLACQALLRGECDMALAGGVSIGVPLVDGYLHQEGGILSPDGHTRTFDAAARGCVGGNGVAVVLLKKLDEALADGDAIHAVVKGSALNNDGALKVGYTAPRVDGQAKVIRAAHIVADVSPESISYVEAHGTATELGDPAEVAALTQAFAHRTDRRGFCALGSVKSNLGHLDAAAGVTGLIKTVLALEHREIPPSLHFEKPNPQIDFAATPFFVNTELRPWPAGDGPRRAGVSSFGIGGTNAHVILEEAPPQAPSGPSRTWSLLPLSARSAAALERAESDLSRHLAAHRDLPLADVAWTLQVGRRAFAHRRIVLCRDLAGALGGLERRGADDAGVCDPDLAPPIAFLLPGQGAQRVGMAGDLYRREAAFREQLDRCAELLRPHLGLDLRRVLYPGAGEEEKAAAQLRRTALAQPALFAVEYALARLWEGWGIRPRALLGHSLGEFVAACLAGVLPLADALRVVARRGALMQGLPAGAMLSVPLGAEEVADRLEGELALAAVNGPASVVVSGPEGAVRDLRDALAAEGVAARALETSHAFHSPVMEPLRERFAAEMAEVELRAPEIPYLSNLTGRWIEAEQATDPAYWGEQLRRTVRFEEGLARLLAAPRRILLEVGPWGALATLARRHPRRDLGTAVVSSSPPPRDATPGEAYLLGALGRLWLAGAEPDWLGLHAQEKRRRVTLPTYPFERRRFWVDAAPQPATSGAESPAGAERRAAPADRFWVPGWKRALPRGRRKARADGSWLFFLDELGFGADLAERVASNGGSVTTVAAGSGFARLENGGYRIDPGRREHYGAVIDELCGKGEAPTRIVHLWTVDGGAAHPEPVLRQRGFTSLIFLAQAIGEQMLIGGFGAGLGETEIALTAVSDHLHQVTGEEAPCPAKATVLGPIQVIPQEYPNLRCDNLDVLLPERRGLAWERLIEGLTGELAVPGPEGEPLVCYRGSERWIPVFDPLRLERPEAVRGLRPGGCYLITGGLGGIGLEVARGLARTVAAKLVLVGRSGFPPRAEWRGRIAAGDPLAAKLESLLEIEKLGGSALILRADVTDEDSMSAALAEAEVRFGPLHGVFHGAGLPGGTLIQRQTPEAAAAVLAPKVDGTLVLDHLLAGVELDFFILFSSQRAFLGGPGQADYAAANRFLESFARSRSERPTLAVAWDGWRETGMGYEGALRNDRAQEDLADGLSNEEGWEALRRLLDLDGGPEVVVSTRDFPARLEEMRRSRAGAALAEAAAGSIRGGAHPRPALATAFVAPRDRNEEMLAEIWSRLLGIAPIGVDDNFFELGGDSVVSLQIVSQANREGLRLTPRQVFQHATIAGLAAVAGGGVTLSAQQGAVTGEVPLTPIQHWFFDQGFADPHHYDQAVLLRCGARLDGDRLERAVVKLHEHHDALRLRFEPAPAGWRQICAPPEGLEPFYRIDLSALAPGARSAAVTAVASGVQRSFDLARGPLSRVALIELGEGRPQRLLWVAHHLVVDVVSWRIVLEDLETLYEAAEPGASLEGVLAAKTTSFKEWAERLRDHARGDEVVREAEYWLGRSWAEVPSLPVDHPEAGNTWGSARTETLVLDREATRALVHEVPARAQAQVRDLLLTALARAFRAWTGAPRLLVDLEGHGRDAIFDDVDLSRTAGWFTDIYPVLLDLDGAGSPAEELSAVKDQLRAVASPTSSYGLLRTLGEGPEARRLAGLPSAEVLFLYTGQVDEAASPSLYMPAPEALGANQSPRARRSHLFDVAVGIEGERLHMRWTWGGELWAPEAVPGLARSYEEALRDLIRQCLSGAAARLTPADFPLADLEAAELETIAEHFPGVVDVYPLSPVQDGLLFHTLYEPGSGVYVTDFHWTFRGRLDPEPLRRAWELVVDRHPALRTAFAWERLRRPMQVVNGRVELPWEEHDWRGSQDREEELRSLLRAERSRGFEIDRPPLMRLHFARGAEDLHTLVWTFHHLILDGWSVATLFAEVLAAWAAFARGGRPALDEPRPYRDYVAWLRAQNLSRAEAFWRRALAGFSRPVPLPGARRTSPREVVRVRRSRTLSEETSSDLQAFVRARRLTLNGLIQGAWALLLASHAGERDVLFGTVSSGRPETLAGVESIVGLFINTLAVRARIDPDVDLLTWLRRLQDQQAEMREFEYTPLVEVHGWTQVPRDVALFETLLVFDNFPAVSAQGGGETSGLEIERVEAGGTDQNSYPLTFTVYPRKEIVLELATDSRWYDEARVDARLQECAGILERIVERPADSAGALLRSLSEERRRSRARAADRLHADNFSRLKSLRPVAVRLEGD